MQEEIVQRTENLAVNTTKLSARVLLKAIRWYLAHRKNKKLEKEALANQPKHGKQTVKELIGQDAGVSTIDVAKTGLKDFQKVARKYGVDYAVKKVKGQNKYLVFFKARDADAITGALTEFADKKQRQQNRPSVRKVLRRLRSMMPTRDPERNRREERSR